MKKLWLAIAGVAVLILGVVSVTGCDGNGGVSLTSETGEFKLSMAGQQDGIWVNGSGKVYATPDIGQPKVESAAKRMALLNPDVKVEKHQLRLTKTNILDLVSAYDVVMDCTDNFPTRFLLNDACYFARKPLCYGAVHCYEGQVTTFRMQHDDNPCYRCLFPEPPPPGLIPSPEAVGLLGSVPAVIGVLQSTECIKVLFVKKAFVR